MGTIIKNTYERNLGTAYETYKEAVKLSPNIGVNM